MTVMPGSDEKLANAIIALLREHGLKFDSPIQLHDRSFVAPSHLARPNPPRETYAETIARIQRRAEEHLDYRTGRSPKAKPQTVPVYKSMPVASDEVAIAFSHALPGRNSKEKFEASLKTGLKQIHTFFDARYDTRTETLLVVAKNPKPQRILKLAHELLRPDYPVFFHRA